MLVACRLRPPERSALGLPDLAITDHRAYVENMGMRETFYATAAQVLPTILIALAIESGMLLSDVLRRHARRTESATDGIFYAKASFESGFRRAGRIRMAAALVVGFAFILGETSALLMLFTSTRGLMAILAATVVWVSLATLMISAAAVPFVRVLAVSHHDAFATAAAEEHK